MPKFIPYDPSRSKMVVVNYAVLAQTRSSSYINHFYNKNDCIQ